jgi:hypothetical protein
MAAIPRHNRQLQAQADDADDLRAWLPRRGVRDPSSTVEKLNRLFCKHLRVTKKCSATLSASFSASASAYVLRNVGGSATPHACATLPATPLVSVRIT